MIPNWGLTLCAALILHACAAAAPSATPALPAAVSVPISAGDPGVARQHRHCAVEHFQAQTAFTTTEGGKVLWSVVLDAATANRLEAMHVIELDCLIDEEVGGRCPNWIHDLSDPQIASYLPDGRLESYGLCEPPQRSH